MVTFRTATLWWPVRSQLAEREIAAEDGQPGGAERTRQHHEKRRVAVRSRAVRQDEAIPTRIGRAGAEILELVLHSAKRPKILEGCSYLRPIVDNGSNHFPTFRTTISRDDNRRRSTQIDMPKVGSNRIQAKPLLMLNAPVAIVGLHLSAEIAPRRTANALLSASMRSPLILGDVKLVNTCRLPRTNPEVT